MSSLDPSQIAEVAVNTGVDVLSDMYSEHTPLYTQYAEVLPLGAESHPFYGDKTTTLLSGGDLVEREDGQAIESTTMGIGYTPQGKIRQFSRKIEIPQRLIAASGSNASARIESLVSEFTRATSRSWNQLREAIVARLFNKGALTAGDLEAFNGSFTGNADPNPKFIYDGLPFFDTAHPIKFGSTTYSNHVAASALTDANLDSAYTVYTETNAVDERGKRIMNTPSRLMVPPALRRTALQLLESELQPGTAQNDINTNRGLLSVLVNPYLDDADGWFMGRPEGVRVIDSGALVPDTWFDNETKCVNFSLEGHFCAYVRDWRPWLARNVAAS